MVDTTRKPGECLPAFFLGINYRPVSWLQYMNSQNLFIKSFSNSSFAHPHICTSAHPHICTSTHLHICTFAHLHICTSTHLHICTSAQPLTYHDPDPFQQQRFVKGFAGAVFYLVIE